MWATIFLTIENGLFTVNHNKWINKMIGIITSNSKTINLSVIAGILRAMCNDVFYFLYI